MQRPTRPFLPTTVRTEKNIKRLQKLYKIMPLIMVFIIIVGGALLSTPDLSSLKRESLNAALIFYSILGFLYSAVFYLLTTMLGPGRFDWITNAYCKDISRSCSMSSDVEKYRQLVISENRRFTVGEAKMMLSFAKKVSDYENRLHIFNKLDQQCKSLYQLK